MTLIVGIKCADGIVVGADGAATLGALGRNTVRQPVKKLVSIRKALIFGLSGPVGMSQFLQHEVEELWEANSFRGNSLHAMGLIRDKIRPHLLREIAVASQTQTVLGNIAHLSALSATMVAGKFSGTLSLFQFDQQGSPEQATENLPFVAIGSGQSLADPFLSFLRRIFWPTRLPTLAEGVLATLWCLRQAIDTNAGGVAEPIQIFTLDSSGKVKELEDTELEEHSQAIESAERALSSFRDTFKSGPTDQQPPTPDSSDSK